MRARVCVRACVCAMYFHRESTPRAKKVCLAPQVVVRWKITATSAQVISSARSPGSTYIIITELFIYMCRCTQTIIIATSGGGSWNPEAQSLISCDYYARSLLFSEYTRYPSLYSFLGSSNAMHDIGRLFSNVYTAHGMERW